MQLCHVEASALGGPDIFVNVWAGDEICNALMSKERFSRFALGEWTEEGVEEPHPITSPHQFTQSAEFRQDLATFEAWFSGWEADGRPDLVPDPTDMRKHVRR